MCIMIAGFIIYLLVPLTQCHSLLIVKAKTVSFLPNRETLIYYIGAEIKNYLLKWRAAMIYKIFLAHCIINWIMSMWCIG
jgi:hypothetical protein